VSADPKFKTRLARRDELVEEILEILRPQLDGQTVVTIEQREQLRAAIAQFTAERGE
jgi:hypothetical protein